MRPCSPLLRKRRATESACARIAASSSARSETSPANVFSSLIETASRYGSTSRTSSPRASRAICTPQSPSHASARAASRRARSPIVRRPSRNKRASATGPTPHSRATGSGSRKPRTSPGFTSYRPSGFAESLAIFATIFTGAMPTETASPVSARTSRRSRTATSRAGPNSRCVPVRSRNASSSESPSSAGVKRAKIAKMRLLSRAYLAMSPRKNTPSGQSRRASKPGIALRTPNTRAS